MRMTHSGSEDSCRLCLSLAVWELSSALSFLPPTHFLACMNAALSGLTPLAGVWCHCFPVVTAYGGLIKQLSCNTKPTLYPCSLSPATPISRGCTQLPLARCRLHCILQNGVDNGRKLHCLRFYCLAAGLTVHAKFDSCGILPYFYCIVFGNTQRWEM